MKIYVAALLAALAVDQQVWSFVPANRVIRKTAAIRSMVDPGTDIDVSVPYDAAARLAYDEWRAKFNKGDFNQVRYSNFKSNYETITVANVSAKKKARDEGKEAAPMLTLNEYGDFSEAEYRDMMEGKKKTTAGDVLGKALEAAQSQSEASTALEEAANALAEEEEKLARQLGLESVEELEVALDSRDGIASDGGELESDNLAREARVRAAYLDWCKTYNKTPDDSRFPTFSSNYLTMEKFAIESGKELELNEYADCTEDEYARIKALSSTRKLFDMGLEAAAKAAVEAREKAAALAKETEAATADARARLEEAQKRQEEWQAETEAKYAELRKKKEEEMKARAEEEAAKRAQIEKERVERQKAQEKEIELLKAQSEAAAIAAAKEEAKRQAARSAQIRALEAKADEEARRKAREFDAKQKQLAEQRASAGAKKTTKPAGFFGAFVAPKKEEPKKVEKPQIEIEIDLSVLAPKPAPAPPKKAVQAAPPKKVSQPVKKEASPQPTFGSFFAPAAPEKKEVKKVVAVPKPAPAPAPKAQEIDISDPVTDALSSFFGGKKKEPVKAQPKPAPVPVPAPASAAKSTPAFSFFGAPQPKETKTVTPKPAPPKPVPEPAAATKSTPAFSFFGPPQTKETKAATPPAKPAPAPVPATPAKSTPAFSFFGSPQPKETKAQSQPVAKPETKKAAPAPAFSFFGAPAPPPAPKTTPKPEQAPRPSLSVFGTAPKAAPPKPAPAAAAKERPSFSIFGSAPAPKPAPAPAPRASISILGSSPVRAKSQAVKPARDVAVPNQGGSIRIFGATFGAPAEKEAPKKALQRDVKVPNRAGTLSVRTPVKAAVKSSSPAPAASKPAFSFFGGSSGGSVSPAKPATKAPPKNMPVLSNWKQNADGSITGQVSNAKQFRDGTKITTSPVKKGATTGQIVTTGSGSQYYLG